MPPARGRLGSRVAKVGRNDPCPCGSGKKYKRCHGDLASLERIDKLMSVAPIMLARHEAKEVQRIEQQGLGRPIISTTMKNGRRVVAVKNRLLFSDKWVTFHDFLMDYVKYVLGADWGNAELRKPLDQRHPILRWYGKLCEQQRLSVREPGKVAGTPMTGAVAAYMHLAYDLYALDHNVELQARLVGRLRSQEHFSGARYEVQVAAMLVRAGFELAFENEDDRSTTHCEFTATHRRTAKQFSVEAKRSESGRVTRQLVRALGKQARHGRVVFIDLNMPDATGPGEVVPPYARRAFDLLRRYEVLDPQAQRLPPAYVFLTNSPWEHHLDSAAWRRFGLADGFHINDFKLDHEHPSLRAAINSRQAHIEMHELLLSMQRHQDIPSTFDGDNPHLAFGDVEQRLLIGDRYRVPDESGAEVEGTLASAVVMEHEKVAVCAVNTDDGRALLVHMPMTEEELAAWKRHPNTFFGEVSRNGKSESVLDLYDFFMRTYTKTPKAKLLEFLAGSPDIARLAELDQGELASLYCERVATSVFARGGPQPKPLLQSRYRLRQDPLSAADEHP